ncbi:hypothetical protein [Microbacterium sp. 179-I 1D1 NHS]|uniref:hypothetical protein n=1 Tax=unclassified Microbacterium TaxID=2609290 RepID=UPI003879CFBA
MTEPVPPYTPQPYPYRPSTAAPSARNLALVALIVAAVPVLLQGVWPGIQIQLYRAIYDPAAIGLVNAVFSLFMSAVSVAALVMGIIAARRDAGARLLGGIAIGIAGSTLVGIGLSLASSTIGGRFF